MKILTDRYLDFTNVLIIPKRSKLSSRSEVILEKTVKFLHSGFEWTGVPILTSNMDTTGTFEMYYVLSKFKIITVIHKHYDITEYPDDLDPNFYCLSTGVSDNDWIKTVALIEKLKPHFLCIDVANGYSTIFVDFCKKVRDTYPKLTIIAGNVATSDMVHELLLTAKVDVVKCGIGSGCFSGDTRVLMSNGTYKNIKDIDIGDKVINKDGNPVSVIDKINNGMRRVIDIKTNNWHDTTTVTPDHKFYSKNIDYNWKQINNVKYGDMLLMPKSIKWDVQNNFIIDLAHYSKKNEIFDDYILIDTTDEKYKNLQFKRFIKSDYELGFIFGLFLSNDTSYVKSYTDTENGLCKISFKYNDYYLLNKLRECIRDIFDYECSVIKETSNEYVLYCYNKYLSIILHEIINSYQRKLPVKYYATNRLYNQGLHVGLLRAVDYNYNMIATLNNNHIYELIYWCRMNLNINVNSCEDYEINPNYTYTNLLSTHKLEQDVEVWDITVDCPTHSFIANNTIVHNSVCSTRIKTGVGVPQLSVCMNCSEVANGLNGFIISDGGCTIPGDVAKAFGAGAHFVMLGGMLSGHDESGGETIIENGNKFKLFYGMSSKHAQDKHNGGLQHYRSSEGKLKKIPYKGKVEDTIVDLLGGLRSTGTYIGAKRIKDFPKCCTFIEVSQQVNTVYDTHVHNV